jgi:putative DNA primase/helicase
MTVNNTDPIEFTRFNEMLTKNAPIGYIPYYLIIQKCGKEPVPGINWKSQTKDFTQALKLMQRGFNIGIAGTEFDSLCILDVDDLTQVKTEEIKPTLTITSRKRIGKHYYYFSPEGSAKKNIPTKNAGELRTTWQYVLAPGSYVPCSPEEILRIPEAERENAGKYTIALESTPADLTFTELPRVYKARYYEMLFAQQDAERKAAERKNRAVPRIKKYKSALWDLTITEVSGVRPTGYKKVPMPSEIHGSETGHNCSVSEGLMHCWRHEVTHCALSYLAVLAGLGDCEQMGKPHNGGSFGIDFQDGHTIYTCWEYAKNHGLIPEDDPIPHSALVYDTLQKNICTETDLVEGRLPIDAYIYAIEIAQYEEGINFGRQ